jgi:hypothetical protein
MTMIKPLGIGCSVFRHFVPRFPNSFWCKAFLQCQLGLLKRHCISMGLRSTAREHHGGFSVPGDDKQDMMTIGRQMIDKFYS